jgi:hypothetical protein
MRTLLSESKSYTTPFGLVKEVVLTKFESNIGMKIMNNFKSLSLEMWKLYE